MSLSLQKGNKISLKKGDGSALTKIIMGLGWDVTPGVGQVDLDASAATFDKNNNLLETIYFGAKTGAGGAIRHSGDNLTGSGDGDDEQIVVDLAAMPANVQNIVFTVTSYRGQKFDVVDNAFVRVVDASNNGEVAKYNLSDKRPYTGMIMARAYRHNGEWKFAAMGEAANGGTVKDLVNPIKAILPAPTA